MFLAYALADLLLLAIQRYQAHSQHARTLACQVPDRKRPVELYRCRATAAYPKEGMRR